MIIISSSLPKTGSTLRIRYEKDLLAHSGLLNAQEILEKKIPWGWVEKFTWKIFVTLILIHLRKGSAVVKTHSQPGFWIKILIWLNIARATFSVRDPRDIVLSIIDHSEKSKKGIDPNKAFIKYDSVEKTVNFVKTQVNENFLKWKNFKKVHFLRYEDLMKNPWEELRSLSNYLQINISDQQISEIIHKHSKPDKDTWNFNKGTTDRYKTDLAGSELSYCNEHLSKEIILLNYNQ